MPRPRASLRHRIAAITPRYVFMYPLRSTIRAPVKSQQGTEMIVSLADDDGPFCEAVKEWHDNYIRQKRKMEVELIVYNDLETLQDDLNKEKFDSNRPFLLLLDLDFNGDKKAGLRFLKSAKAKGTFHSRRIPIVIYSNSDDLKEIDVCYAQFANSFVWKGGPSEKDQRQRFIELIEFWYNTAQVPSLSRN